MPPFSSDEALYERSLSSVLPLITNSTRLVSKTSSAEQEPVLDEAQESLTRDLQSILLEELYPHLWLVAKPSGASIDAINVHKVKGRSIIPAEDPSLHLVWHHENVYIKPIPHYLLSYKAWEAVLPDPLETPTKNGLQPLESKGLGSGHQFDRKIALGFLRSYAYLIQHPLDLTLAQEAHLLPKDITWPKWVVFIKNFRHLDDSRVSNRYHYGQLRLSRLNWAVRLYRPKNAPTLWFYTIPHWSVEIYLNRAVTPLLFVFANLSLVLSSMQVMLAAPDGESTWVTKEGVRLVRVVFWRFSIIILVLSLVIWTLLFILPLAGLSWQLVWGYRHRTKRTCTA